MDWNALIDDQERETIEVGIQDVSSHWLVPPWIAVGLEGSAEERTRDHLLSWVRLLGSLILAPEASLLFVFVRKFFAVASGFSRKGLSGYNSVITSIWNIALLHPYIVRVSSARNPSSCGFLFLHCFVLFPSFRPLLLAAWLASSFRSTCSIEYLFCSPHGNGLASELRC